MLGLASAVIISFMMLPISHAGTAIYAFQMRTSSDMRHETGWLELVDQVAHVRDTLPPADQDHLGIMAGNYGEAGALALYGPARGLPDPISFINSFYYRGYRPPAPQAWLASNDMGCRELETARRFPLPHTRDGGSQTTPGRAAGSVRRTDSVVASG